MKQIQFVKLVKLIFLSALLCRFGNAPGQGCSDAGFCSLSALKPVSSDSASEKISGQHLKSGLSYGKGDHSIAVISGFIEFSQPLGKKIGLEAKVIMISQRGNGISSSGISDVYLTSTYRWTDRIRGILGVKIPAADGNKKYNGITLPMDYQSSLGTFDLILGAAYSVKNLDIFAAGQFPLTQNNNSFIAENYPVNSELRLFQSTNKFNRASDLLLRVAYAIRATNKLTVTPGVLPIYHLSNDTFVDFTGMRQSIENSNGLTLNTNFFLDYQASKNSSLQCSFAFPLVVRTARPDGLTRSFVFGLEYKHSFR